MKCFYHTDREAVATCQRCGKALCRECAAKYNPCLCDECKSILDAADRQAESDKRQKYLDALVDTRSEFIRACIAGVVVGLVFYSMFAGGGDVLRAGLLRALRLEAADLPPVLHPPDHLRHPGLLADVAGVQDHPQRDAGHPRLHLPAHQDLLRQQEDPVRPGRPLTTGPQAPSPREIHSTGGPIHEVSHLQAPHVGHAAGAGRSPPLPPFPSLTMFSLLHKTAPRRGAVLACVSKAPVKSAGWGLTSAG